MTYTSTRVFPETLEAIRKLQAIRTLHELESETVPELLHRLVVLELERASDNSEFTAATYRLSKVILENTADDEWVTADEFKQQRRERRQREAVAVG